ncbi:MAG: type I restriction endonuclease [Candidatus Peregrinibacteria bacterium]
MSTNLKEIAIEELITSHLVEQNGFVQKFYSGEHAGHYDKKECIDTVMLFDFLENSQPEEMVKLKENHGGDYQKRLLVRVQKEIKEKGVLHILRKGVKDLNCHFQFMYFQPNSTLNPELAELWTKNTFAVARQLYYSEQNKNSLDMVVLINGILLVTLELKNLITGQTVKDAIVQYKNNRSSKEELFRFERCLVHFAVDTELVYMATKLADEKTWFLPFNKGYQDGAGNPPSDTGLRTEYLWHEVLTKSRLSRLVGSFIQSITEEKKDQKTGKRVSVKKLIFPRYHQMDVVTKLLQESRIKGTGQKYLIQHSAGSGKSNSISWLAHQLSGLHREDGKTNVFDSILIITDRRVLDTQLRGTVSSFEHLKGVIETVTSGKELKTALENGKRIIITTIQKFPVIADTMGELGGQRFAVIIDEAHSSTSGEMIAKLNKTMTIEDGDEITDEDVIVEVLKGRQMLTNASYFAFTATPKNKTLELFGVQTAEGKYRAFHSYTMKQAIDEGFILDVLSNYTTYQSYYQVVITGDKESEYQKKRANRQLKGFVESHPHTIDLKARIMLDHFYYQVYLKGLIGGKAKAMLVCGSRKNAVQYHFAFKNIIAENDYPLGIITAFSGDVNLDGNEWNEPKLNAFSSSKIPDEFDGGTYQILICANKFQTGFDQPLLQTMYVDKRLGGVSAVQTLSRLNRVHPEKDSTFVLDFYNTEDDIQKAFEPYYQATILSCGSDPNKLNDLKDALDGFGVYDEYVVHTFATKVLSGASVESLHALVDSVVENIKKLPEEQIDDFKDKSKSYVKFYAFIAQIVPYTMPEMEELYQFLKVLTKKISSLGSKETVIGQDVLDAVDFDSYRNQKTTSNARIHLAEADDLPPIPSTVVGSGGDDPKDILDNIVTEFNKHFGTNFSDEDKVKKMIADISNDIIADKRMLNSLQDSGKANRMLVFQKLLDEKITENVDDHLELYNSYHDNQDFKAHLTRYVDKVVKEKMKGVV